MDSGKRGLAYWRSQLSQAPLPVLSDDEALAALLLPSASLQQIQAGLQADLPLALDAVLLAARLPRIQGEVQGLQHALNVLGAEKVQHLVRARSKRPLDPARPAHRACLQAIAVSRFAARLVDSWERPKLGKVPGGNPEYLEWVALLLGLARWKLPLLAPELHLQVERRARAGERRARVEAELLGCSIDELNAALLEDAGLPTDALLRKAVTPHSALLGAAAGHAWTAALAPELPPAVARWLRQRTTVSVLAHLLAWSIHDGWYSRRTLLLLRTLSAHLNQPLERVTAGVRATALRASRAPEFVGRVFVPAQQLFWPPAPPRSLQRTRPVGAAGALVPPATPARPAATSAAAAAAPAARETVVYSGFAATPTPAPARGAPAPHSVAAAATTTAQPDADVVHAFSQNCLHGRYGDLRQFMTATSLTLEKGLGLRRCLLFLKAANTDRLGCYFAHGFDGLVEARKLGAPAADDNLVARIFARSGGSLWIDHARVAAARLQLPAELRPYAPAGGFLLGTIQLKERPVGVIWADGGDCSTPLGAQHYAQFRHMIHHFGSEFSRLTSAMRR